MADTKLSALTAITGANVDAANDLLYIDDVSVTTSKKILVTELGKALGLGSQITNSLGGDVALSNTGSYFDGPSCAQGTTGTWFASGTVTFLDSNGPASIILKLWDGTTVIASCVARVTAGATSHTASLSGFIASPAANIRISANDPTSTGGSLKFNSSGFSRDCTLTVFRVA